MNLEKVKKIIAEFASKRNLNLYNVTYNRSESILEVRFDEDLNLDKMEIISNELSAFLDEYDDEFEDNYILDVSNVGLERDIFNEDQMKQAVGNYICVKTKDNEYYGNLVSFDGNILELDVKDKNKTKKITVEYDKVKKARYAVEF